MKHYLILFAFCILQSAFCTKVFAQPLDSVYHDNAEILAELQHYAEAYPDWMTFDSIGHGQQLGQPIWCAKISDNPRDIEPEAALLFVGQVHAEEVVGIELVLEIMKQMLENNEDNAMRQRLEGLEIYIIPTANPDGLDIVHSGVDVTYRKNCRDNIGDGQLRIQDGEGWDTSGVDINRNFGTHWDRGDTLYRPEENLRYNGYRGPAPFSEAESRALRDLALSRPFLYSIVYHSSRTGNSTELFIAPWFWRENGIIKRPPDYLAINALGEKVAGMLPGMRDRNSHYRPVQSMQRKGQLQDWFYAETGCIQYMAEVAADIHPDADTMRMVVADNLPAVWYLMDLALGLQGLDGFGTLTVNVTALRHPIAASITIDGVNHPILTRRMTNPINGRFDWLLPVGNHSVSIEARGFGRPEPFDVEIASGQRTVLETHLIALEADLTRLRLQRESPEDATEAMLKIYDFRTDELLHEMLIDTTDREGPDSRPGIYHFVATQDGYLPRSLYVNIGGVEPCIINLPPADEAYHEDFSSDLGWSRSGNGWGVASFDGRSCLTESVTGDYPYDADLWLQLDSIAVLDTARATMRIVHLPYCEPQDDYQEISWWTNPNSVHSKRYSQLRACRRPAEGDGGGDIPNWDTLYVSLDSLEPGPLQVKFHEVSDDAIGEDGWLIDDVSVFKAEVVNSVPVAPLTPYTLHLSPCFPNPFNSTTSISFSLPKAGWTRMDIVDINGRLVERLANGRLEAGEHRVVWNAGNLGSGVYLVRLESGSSALCRKVVLLH